MKHDRHTKMYGAILALSLLCACGGGAGSSAVASSRSTGASTGNLKMLSVAATDAAISYRPDVFNIYRECDNGVCADKEKLFVFLPGSGGLASQHQKIADVIGKTGIRVLVLAYQNDGMLDGICGSSDTCYSDARRDRVEGAINSPYVNSVADGIKSRLLKALQALGWSEFYSGDTLLSDKMIFGGFSQGAGMAAWIGKHYSVARVCQFSGTWDNVNGASATWLSAGSVTPASRFYGFSHQDDSMPGGISYLDRNWQALGMGTNPVQLYSTGLSGQKIFANDTDSACLANTHACSVVDASTPANADGSPRFSNAWKYVCGV